MTSEAMVTKANYLKNMAKVIELCFLEIHTPPSRMVIESIIST